MGTPSPTRARSGNRSVAGTGALFLTIVLVSFVISLGLSLFIRPVVTNEFELLERRQLLRDLDRVDGMLRVQLEALGSMAGDWAEWDDTAEFMSERDLRFITVNLHERALRTLGLDGFVFFDTSGRPVFSIQLTEPSGISTVSDEVVAEFTRHRELFELRAPASRGGEVLSTRDGPMLVASAPITRSDLEFPAHGTLVAFERLDDTVVDEVEKRLLLTISVDAPGTQGHWSPTVREAARRVATGGSLKVVPVQGGRVAGVGAVSDGDGRLAFTLAVIEEREVFESGERIARLLSAIVLGAGLILGIATASLVEMIARRRTSQQYVYLAEHDHLTRLPNRRLFEEILVQELARSERSGSGGAILWLDLDGFKQVNDECGHHAGDLLLMAVAEFLAKSVRVGDTVARIGGDEFAVLLPETPREVAVSIADRLLKDLSAVEFEIDGEIMHSAASVGIVAFPADGASHEQLLSRADKAMYAAKRRGQHSYHEYLRHGELGEYG